MHLLKATGDDGVASEMLKASGETGVKILHKICNIIWKSKKWPGSWKKLVMIALYKKGDSAVCENYRTLSLISHASKVLLNIIVKRIEQSYETELNINQAGFRRGVGTRDQIFNLQQIIEKYLENGKPIYALFLDYSKAFDSVSHIGLWKILKKLNTPSHIIQLFQSLYEDCTAVVRLNCGTTDDININRGVRQGCPASPILFNLYTEQIVRESADRCEQGLKVSGKLINNLRYADDTVLLAESQEGLQELADTVNGAGVKRDLHLNIKKTKAMVITKNNENCTIRINSRPIDCVDRFVYLGGVVTKNGDTAEMIKTRICSAKARFTDFDSVWKDKDLALKLKINILTTVIWPVALYGCEAWTIKKEDERRIEAFEMWGLRRILGVHWSQHISNEEVLRRCNMRRMLFNTMKTRKLRYFGHLIRSDSFQREMMEGYVEGRRGVGRPRKKWTDDILQWTGRGSLGAVRREARDRYNWRRILRTHVGNPQQLRTLP